MDSSFPCVSGVEVKEEAIDVDLSVEEFFECRFPLSVLLSWLKLAELFGEIEFPPSTMSKSFALKSPEPPKPWAYS